MKRMTGSMDMLSLMTTMCTMRMTTMMSMMSMKSMMSIRSTTTNSQSMLLRFQKDTEVRRECVRMHKKISISKQTSTVQITVSNHGKFNNEYRASLHVPRSKHK
jgi:hypothetical protein